MPNTITDLAADAYTAVAQVGREEVGFIPSSTINADDKQRVAIGDPVRGAFTRKAAAGNLVASMSLSEGTNQIIDNKTATITKARSVEIPWEGEEERSVNNGAGFRSIFGDQLAQAMRTITNEIEVDLAVEAYTNASRAVGVAGTTPFGSNYNVVNSGRQILVDNGFSPAGQTSLVMSTLAGTQMRNLSNLQKVNEAGTTSMLRQGVLEDLSGIMLRESANVQSHTKGTGTSYQLNGALAVDDTSWTVDTGSGTVVAGDILTAAADTTNKYCVNTDLAGGVIVVGDPGARQIIADNNALTVGDDYTANVMFNRSALELIMRPFTTPPEGDLAVESFLVQDPHSGLVFEIRIYVGRRKKVIEVSSAWGVKAWDSNQIVTVMG